jgi:L-arabinose isomerase
MVFMNLNQAGHGDPELAKELRWSEAYYHLARGLR